MAREFEPKKSELIHFTRAREACTIQICLGDTIVSPVTSARFLGVWLDRKLRWKDHISKIKAKMAKTRKVGVGMLSTKGERALYEAYSHTERRLGIKWPLLLHEAAAN
ncbi:hypothetical protein PG994_001391 [Apiospora phragmitis]|uniref:Uncharacterized protein n=1 Tax=Apiospora phragmitis TaxID=2905665 RepID=A0ABR1WTG6_9PEZI